MRPPGARDGVPYQRRKLPCRLVCSSADISYDVGLEHDDRRSRLWPLASGVGDDIRAAQNSPDATLGTWEHILWQRFQFRLHTV